jgi:hypothetical protein
MQLQCRSVNAKCEADALSVIGCFSVGRLRDNGGGVVAWAVGRVGWWSACRLRAVRPPARRLRRSASEPSDRLRAGCAGLPPSRPTACAPAAPVCLRAVRPPARRLCRCSERPDGLRGRWPASGLWSASEPSDRLRAGCAGLPPSRPTACAPAAPVLRAARRPPGWVVCLRAVRPPARRLRRCSERPPALMALKRCILS